MTVNAQTKIPALIEQSGVLRNRSLTSKFTARRSDKRRSLSTELIYVDEIIRTAKPETFRGCDPKSLETALLDLAATGLTLAPRERQCYLVPYGGQIKLEIMYEGLTQAAYSFAGLKQLHCDVVREGDTFTVTQSSAGPEFNHSLAHLKNTDKPRAIIGAYCFALFEDGARFLEVMDLADLKKVMDAATKKNKGSLPFTYKLWPGEMFKKAALRRATKRWPRSSGMDRFTEILDKHSTPLDFGPADSSPAPEGGELTISEDQYNELDAMIREAFADENEERLSARVSHWMEGIADVFGVSEAELIPASSFEAAKERIASRIERVKNK